MRIEHNGTYAVVASNGGAPAHPVWYRNIVANPLVELQDGAIKQEMRAREVFGEERRNGGSARTPPGRISPPTEPVQAVQAVKFRCSSWSRSGRNDSTFPYHDDCGLEVPSPNCLLERECIRRKWKA
jgi:F420H(2)-dependent quinone reductase